MANVSTRIQVPGGQELDPVFVSLSNLCRVGENEFRACMEYVIGERAERAKRQAEREERQRAASAEFAREAAVRAATLTAAREKEPWRFST